MNSRLAIASSARPRLWSRLDDNEVKSGPPLSLPRPWFQCTKPADASVPAIAAPPSHSGHVSAEASAQPSRNASENGRVDDIVSPKIQKTSELQFLKFKPGQFAVASVDDRVQQEQ